MGGSVCCGGARRAIGAGGAKRGRAMRIVVDYDRCESNGVCMAILPEVFEVRDDDFMYVLDETPPEKFHAKVRQAVNSCPTQALSIREDDEAPAPAKDAAKGTAAPAQGAAPAAKPAAEPKPGEA